MEEIIKVQEQFYILATSSRVDDHTRVLKHGETFAVFDRTGSFHPVGLGEQGLYHDGTRRLSRLELLLDGRRPVLLTSTVLRETGVLQVDLTNPDLTQGEEVLLPRDTLHIFSASFLWRGTCYTRLRIRNYALYEVAVRLAFTFGADFADVFEVRGTKRERRGRLLEPVVGRGTVQLAYEGLDGRVRRTRLTFSPTPAEVSEARAEFRFPLPPHEERMLLMTIVCEDQGEMPRIGSFDESMERAQERLRRHRAGGVEIQSSNQQFNAWIERSATDVEMMITDTPEGPYPYAGIPWFSTPFGRDGIITALEVLWLDPRLARGVLSFLAANQAREISPEQDAEPGKILHETRGGEMAALGEIPFGRYYGSIDATPLFVVLAGAYYERTGDRELVAALWPNLEAALGWIDRYGDADGDGFVEYTRRSAHGLIAQGWKDSFDSVFHADGSLAEEPIALCEVQAYVFAARRAAAGLARVLGREEQAAELERQAEELRQRFEDTFWCEALGTYALALDGAKRPCRVRASNAGHCLFAGIASPERARRVAQTLLEDASYSGWGIRTVDSGEVRYNPMSYHNGSIWPHDNALIALGFARYGLKEAAVRLLAGLFDASRHFDLYRVPELFCGFHRRQQEGPTLYPVACSPQAWAAGSVFLFLQACLGLAIDAPQRQLRFERPMLPPSLRSLEIRNLRIGEAEVDLSLERHPHDVGLQLERREGEVQLVTVK
jgi:glycogen debranching enzyme